jgi:ACS family sodium-dependent inorganic phosphate cotransporter-like MFS transporter 5
MLVGGVLCRYVSSGWIHNFLLSGILGFIWLPLWMWKVTDSPEEHRSISNTERDYIQNIIEKNLQNKNRRPISLGSLPWKNIVRSKPVIGLFITELCCVFGLFFFLSNLGKILTEIYHIPSQYAGYILACGFMLMLIGSISSGNKKRSNRINTFF